VWIGVPIAGGKTVGLGIVRAWGLGAGVDGTYRHGASSSCLLVWMGALIEGSETAELGIARTWELRARGTAVAYGVTATGNEGNESSIFAWRGPPLPHKKSGSWNA